MYKTIDIDKNLIVSAINHSKDRMNYEYNRFNQNNTFRLNMILIGTLGELVFKKYLEVIIKPMKWNFKLVNLTLLIL